MQRRAIAVREVVVIAVLAMMLLMLLVIWLSRTRTGSQRVNCERRQQQTALAIMQHDASQDHYPGFKNVQAIDQRGDAQPTGWVFEVLPFLGYALEQPAGPIGDLRQIATDPNIERPYADLFEDHGPAGPDALRGRPPRQRIRELLCPDDPSKRADEQSVLDSNPLSWIVNTGLPDANAFGHLPADWNANGIFQNRFDKGAADQPDISSRWVEDRDGLDNTLMLSENVDAGQWTNTAEPLLGFTWALGLQDGEAVPGEALLAINQLRGAGDGTPKFARPSSFHPQGVNVVYAGGRTQFLSEAIDWLVYTRLMTSDGQNARLPGTASPIPAAYQ